MRPNLDAGATALWLAVELGWALFPLHWPDAGRCSCGDETCERVAKHPLIATGFKGASSHPEQIAEWWTRWPHANIGLWPGGSGLLVIDVDGPVGHETARTLGLLDVETLACVTGRPDGGRHLYFRHPGGVIRNSSRNGIDVRGDAGYVVIPPSKHASGATYRWEGALDGIAEMPPSLLAGLRPPPAPPRPAPRVVPSARMLPMPGGSNGLRAFAAWLERVPTGLAAGDGRNQTAYRIAARALEAMSRAEAHEVLRAWNGQNAAPLDEQELETTLDNAARYRRAS